MKLWQIVLLLAAIAAMGITTVNYMIKFKKLGAAVIKGKNGIIYTNRKQLTLLGAMIGLFLFSLFTSTDLEADKMYFIFYGVVMFLFTLMQLVYAFYPKGVYENGVSTDSAVLLYSEVSACYFSPEKNVNLSKFVFNDSGRLFSAAVNTYIDSAHEAEAKKYLKSKGCFKRNYVR